ncbi:MAG TPA: alpha-galactosidase [Polyangia bacterium]|jgi:hypothetical protein
MRWLTGLIALFALAACGSGGDVVSLKIENDWIRIDVTPADGAFNLNDKRTFASLKRVHLAADVVTSAGERLDTTLGRTMSCRVDEDPARVLVTCDGTTGAGFAAQLSLAVPKDRAGLVRLGASFTNATAAPITVRRFYSFRTAASEGGSVLLGNDAKTVRVLQNGSDEILDFYVAAYPGDTPLTDRDQIGIAGVSTYSNGSAIAHDLTAGASLLVGVLDLDWAVPQIAFAGSPQAKPIGMATPMTELWAEARFGGDVPVAPGAQVSLGTTLLVLGAATPFDALETYADEVAAARGVTLPPAPLSGWDSWYVGSATTDLSEAGIATSAAGLADRFGPYGLASMELDEGWQDEWGDWNARATFPSGMAATAAAIKAQGLTPELWIAPVAAKESSQLYRDHPDWFVAKDDYGRFLVPADTHGLDLGRPETLALVQELGARVQGWGYDAVKMDFVYYALLGQYAPAVGRTRTSLYREIVGAFRDALGPGVYLTNISQAYLNYGLAHGFRLGLDDWPCWEGGDCTGDHPNNGGIQAQGIKPQVRMAARRYWMNGRIFWNHQDQIFFRDLTLDEARAWVSVAGLSGGMVSLGEDPAALTDEQVDAYRRILPLTGSTARPLDLFTREFPEQWAVSTGPGTAVVGLFNWGRNVDLSRNPSVERADGEPVTHDVDLAALGLDATASYLAYELWTDTLLGPVSGSLTLEVPPHAGRVVRLVPRTTNPTYVGTNRHILMGPGFVTNPGYTVATGTFAAEVLTTPGFAHVIVLAVPAGATATAATLDGTPVTMTPASGAVRVSFTGADAASHVLSVAFAQ